LFDSGAVKGHLYDLSLSAVSIKKGQKLTLMNTKLNSVSSVYTSIIVFFIVDALLADYLHQIFVIHMLPSRKFGNVLQATKYCCSVCASGVGRGGEIQDGEIISPYDYFHLG